ncbi:hypothetical protein Y1Q_0012465 [Alligator mississippiensis]|uniref:Uncharacterized protein n=1 Tax=Alligator mississippiensis TaxID=8496 RepID=A0A151M7Q8_ALLMI|nr:hypothetical protein Y1Q_0012465 [Alligator mississippiensis]
MFLLLIIMGACLALLIVFFTCSSNLIQASRIAAPSYDCDEGLAKKETGGRGLRPRRKNDVSTAAVL